MTVSDYPMLKPRSRLACLVVASQLDIPSGSSTQHGWSPTWCERRSRGSITHLPFSDVCAVVLCGRWPNGHGLLQIFEWHKHDADHCEPLRSSSCGAGMAQVAPGYAFWMCNPTATIGISSQSRSSQSTQPSTLGWWLWALALASSASTRSGISLCSCMGCLQATHDISPRHRALQCHLLLPWVISS